MASGGDTVRSPHRQSREEDQYRSLQGVTPHHLDVPDENIHETLRTMALSPTSAQEMRTVANKYTIGRIVGSGAYGKVYQGSDLTNQEKVGIKVEDMRTDNVQLMHESRLYNILKGGKGIPNMRWFGKEQDYNVLVLDLLGPNLLHLFKVCNQRFSLKTVIMLAYQMIDRVEYVHSRGLVHRDLKPDNFLMGCGRQGNQVFLIDFGLAKEYIDPVTRQHIAYRDKKSFTGTARYASLNQHCGIEHSRRDDIESIGYILMYFLRGNLPWQGYGQRFIDQKNHEQLHNRIKMDTSIEELCKGYPPEFAAFLQHSRSLGFYQEPDYSYLRRLFRDLFIQKGFQLDHVYDWTVYMQLQAQRSSQSSARSPGLGNYGGQVKLPISPPLTKSELRREVPFVAAN